MIPRPLCIALTALAIAGISSGCASTREESICAPAQSCPVCPVCPGAEAEAPPPENPMQPAQWSDLVDWNIDRHAQAWPALLQSCSVLGRKSDWEAACNAAKKIGERPSDEDAERYFINWFTPWKLINPDGSDEGLVTGYFEPVIEASREKSPTYRWPIHAPPDDMLVVDLADTHPDLKHMRLRGRIEGRNLVPYWTRGEIGEKENEVPARTLFWAKDPVALFFLHVQGSGQLELPDGSRTRIGYADQNGHQYVSIGRWLIDQGELETHQASMQGIRNWAQNNPERLKELLAANPSYVFFRELPLSPGAGGPIGALGVPLTEERSIATDPRYVPPGAPVFLATTEPLSDKPLRQLMMTQDTGGAIKGVVRADFFWGSGPQSGELAGRMRQQGKMWLLLPRGVKP